MKSNKKFILIFKTQIEWLNYSIIFKKATKLFIFLVQQDNHAMFIYIGTAKLR